MRRLTLFAIWVSALSAACAISANAGLASSTRIVSGKSVPSWLVSGQTRALRRIFGHPKVLHTYHLWSKNEVAVVFEFRAIETCVSCSAPSQSALPRGRMVRLTFDRRTHRIESKLEFCEVRGSSPPRALCLRR